jgi:hypothetical protein
MRLSWPGMAYGAVAAWQPSACSSAKFYADYSNQLYTPEVAHEVASALEKLNASEYHLQRAIGHDTMNRLWSDSFAPDALKRCSEHQEDLRQSRILAEEAQEHLGMAIDISHNAYNFDDLMLASQLLDYAGIKFLYGVEIEAQWQLLGKHPTGERVTRLIGGITSQQHGKAVDMMDMITGLRPKYQQAWLAQYSPYRLGSALGRWDAEYEYWRQSQSRLQLFSSKYHADRDLPPLQSVIGLPNIGIYMTTHTVIGNSVNAPN